MSDIEGIRERLISAGIRVTDQSLQRYMDAPDILGNSERIPVGYKRCTKCGEIKKILLFNKNGAAKDQCTSQCKECQKKKVRIPENIIIRYFY